MRKFLKYLLFFLLPFLVYLLSFILGTILPGKSASIENFSGLTIQVAYYWPDHAGEYFEQANHCFVYLSIFSIIVFIFYKLFKKQKFNIKNWIFFISYYFLIYIGIQLVLNFFGFELK